MPRTIYEFQDPEVVYPEQRPQVPSGWAYIGATVLRMPVGDSADWEWSRVLNMVGNNWLTINRIADGVDYSVTDITWNSATIVINDWDDFDYLEYLLSITPSGGQEWTETLPDDTRSYQVKTLKPNTKYTVNLVAKYRDVAGGGWTADSIQTFTTPDNPTPTAPVLSYSNATNSSIKLAWTAPAGSTAVKYNLYIGVGSAAQNLSQSGLLDRFRTVQNLKPDTKYYYQVSGVNASGMEGPKSNAVRVATGHEEAFRTGSFQEWMQPASVGSWRTDIHWKLWYARSRNNVSLYQGYWQGDPRTTGRTPAVILRERAGRYWGCIRYDTAGYRAYIDSRYGSGAAASADVTRTEFRRLYRMVDTGGMYGTAHYMVWHIGGSAPHWGGQPTILSSFRHGGANDADHVAGHDTMKPGQGIDWYRLPRYFGKSLIQGSYNGGGVDSIILYRDDDINTYNGTAGYGEWCGHLQYDRDNVGWRLSNPEWRYSNLSLLISANYRVKTQSYVAPSGW